MVGCEDKSRLAVCIEIFYKLRDLLDTLVYDFDVVKIFFRVRSERMARGIEPQQM